MLRRLGVLTAIAFCGTPGAADAAGTWLAAGPPASDASQSAANPDVAIDHDGNVLAVWDRSDGTTQRVEAAFRPAGGAFGTAVPLSDGGRPASSAQVAFDPQGNALAAWMRFDGAVSRVQAAFRPAGGSFAPAQTISPPAEDAKFPRLAFDGAGNALVAWVAGPGPGTMKAAFRPAGGDFGAVDTISAPGYLTNQFDLAFDRQGNAMVAWPRKDSNVDTVTDARVEAAVRPAGGAFASAIAVSPLSKAAGSVQLAFDPGGGALVTYLYTDITPVTDGWPYRVQAAYRPAGGVFGPPQDISATTSPRRAASFPDVAIDADGTAVAVWMEGFWAWAATRPAGGAFAPAVRISPVADANAPDPRIAFDAKGNATAMWTQHGSDPGFRVTVATRPAGATDFGPPQPVSDAGDLQTSSHHMAFDPAGNGVAAWLRTDGSHERIEVAGYDGAAPALRGTTFPAPGLTGSPLGFAATALDVWSPVTLSWQFGDGATATGGSVVHAYGTAGTYAATVSATDAVGNTSTAASTVSVAGAPGTMTPVVDRVALTLTGLRLSRPRFRAARRGAAFAATGTGATVRFTLSEAARVRFTVERATTGRRVGRSCRRATAKNRRRAPCTRYVTVKGSATLTGHRGANHAAFRGRLGGRALAVGRYRLLARATDPAGHRSAVRRVAFRIVRR